MSLASCAKKPIDEHTFEKIMGSKFDFEITDVLEWMEGAGDNVSVNPNSNLLTAYYVATDEDSEFTVSYCLFKEAEEAGKYFDTIVERFERNIEDGRIKGEIIEINSDDFSKFTISGSFVNADRDFHYVFILADNMTIDIIRYSDDKDDVAYVNKIVKKLGY